MSFINIAGDTSGSISLTVPLVAGTNTATLPAATGTVMVSGNMPAFSAYASANQSISSATFTKVTLNAEIFDTASAFDSTTNYRFTPQVAGYYQFSFGFSCAPSTGQTRVIGFLYKNGSVYTQGNDSVPFSSSGGLSVGSVLIFLNGSTDYVELYGYIIASVPIISSGSPYTYMTASLVRAA